MVKVPVPVQCVYCKFVHLDARVPKSWPEDQKQQGEDQNSTGVQNEASPSADWTFFYEKEKEI